MKQKEVGRHLILWVLSATATVLATSATAQSSTDNSAAAPPAASSPGERSSTQETVLVTARLRREDAQSVPISLSVVDSTMLEKTRTDNLAELSLLVPSVNYSSPNPRNTAYTIRGLASTLLPSPRMV